MESIWTVQQEMGHASLEMLKDVYVPVGTIRRRGADVAYPLARMRRYPPS